MKLRNYKILVILLLLTTTFNYSNTIDIKYNLSFVKQDTIKFHYQDKFEKIVKIFLNGKKKNYKREDVFGEDILDTEEKALSYAKYLFMINLPKINPSEPVIYTISQDKTSRIWFVNCRLVNAVFGGDVHMIFFKNNCKLLFFYKTS